MLVYGKCECFVMQMLYVCVLCAFCGSSQCCILHDLQFLIAGQGCKRRPYGRGILPSWSHNCLVLAMSVSFCLPHPVAVSAFMICRGLCACTEMLWMCLLYVSFGSKVRPRTFGCIAMGSALLCIFRSRLLVYSAESGMNRVQVVLSGFSMRLVCRSEQLLVFLAISWKMTGAQFAALAAGQVGLWV